MSQTIAYVGAALLVAATIPQLVRLARTRSADDFGWPFVALNVTGIALLATRSVELREPAFVATNLLTLAFWIAVALAKGVGRKAGRPQRPREQEAITEVVGRLGGLEASGPPGRLSMP